MRNLFQIIDAKYYNSLTSFIEDITKKQLWCVLWFTVYCYAIFDTVNQYLYIYLSGGATSCGPCCETEAVFTCELFTWTFDLLTSKWGHGSPMSWAFFLQIKACYTLPFSN